MELPKASRTVKRTIDLVPLFAASVWLGGFAVLFVLTLSDGAALGLTSLDAPVAIDAFRSQFIVPCIPFLMATAVLYGVLTSWGFAKHSWLVAKWVAEHCCYCWLCIAAVFDGNGGRNARVRCCAVCPFGV